MSYLHDFEAELAKKLAVENDNDALVRWIGEKVLESYRNGIKAGNSGVQVKRDGRSRRSGDRPPQERK